MRRGTLAVLAASALMLALPASGLATALAVVASAPNMSMSFSAGTIFTGASSTLTMRLSNPDAIDMSDVGFTATLPSGVTSASTSKSACGGTLAVYGQTITLTGGQLAASGSCSTTVSVRGAAAGSRTVSARPSNGGATGATARATLRVLLAPVVTAQIVEPSTHVDLGGRVELYGQAEFYIVIENPNDVAIPGVSLTLTAPGDLQIVGWDNLGCGATMSPYNEALAKAVTVTGGTIPANLRCIFGFLTTTDPQGQYTFSTSIKTQYGSMPAAASITVQVGSLSTASLNLVYATPKPSPTAAAPSDDASPAASQSPVPAATIGGDSGLPTVALGAGGLAALAALGAGAFFWRRRRAAAKLPAA
jgi:hypothetical protein